MLDHRVTNKTIIAVMVATTAGLFFRSWLQVALLARDFDPVIAADLSYLVVLPIMVLLLLPLWRPEKHYLAAQFRRADLTRSLVFRALAIGVLLRMLWWSQSIVGTSFGLYTSSTPEAIVGPILGFDCPPPSIMLLGFMVTTILTPAVEEFVFRSYVLGFLRQHGPLIAILISATLFTIFHRTASWPFVLFAGTIFGLLYWSTRSLWSSLVAHATFNGLVLFDWRCLSVQWNPLVADTPILRPGLTGLVLIIAVTSMLVVVLHKEVTEAKNRLGNDQL